MKALLDGDIYLYRVGFGCKDEPKEIAKHTLGLSLQETLEAVNGDKNSVVFISGETNYRKDIYPAYKANRKERPEHYDMLRESLITDWSAVESKGCEADDLLGINQTDDTIICSIDKDLLQIPGKHFNIVKKEFTEISEFQGWYNFYIQLLMGDRVDNVPCLEGVGIKTAEKILAGMNSKEEMYERVLSEYEGRMKDKKYMHLMADLLYIQRKEGDRWSPP
jgi:5'-3' exonuclease